jgi:uncharacterized protein YprB with RNaseH-like and TPR domain
MMEAYLDIETTGKWADEGRIVAIGIWKERPQVRICVAPWEERRALEWLAQHLRDVTLIVTWFGSGFDLPFLKTRAALLKVNLQILDQIPSLDLCEWCRKNLLLSKYSLEAVAEFFGMKRRVPFEGSDVSALSKLASSGDRRAANRIAQHCQEDLYLLREVHRRLSNTLKL